MFWLAISMLSYLALINFSAEESFRIVCYYTNWSQFRHGEAKFVPENIDPSLCTHFVYAFAGLNIVAETTKVELKATEWNDESTGDFVGMYERFQRIRRRYSKVKTLLAVDGWAKLTNYQHNMLTSDVMIQEFSDDAVTFLRKHKFDGLDVHWKYEKGSLSPGTKGLVSRIFQNLLTTFNTEAKRMKRPRLLLVLSADATSIFYLSLIDGIHSICRYIDFFNVITHVFDGPWNNFTGHFNPFFEKNNTGANSTDYVCPKEKFNLGLGFFGRSFTLTLEKVGVKEPDSPGIRGFYTRSEGFLAHYEVCKMKSKSTKEMYMKDNKIFYIIHGNQWVAYEKDKSIRTKVCYTKQFGFGGVMIWALDLDDFNGEFCGKGKWPLLKAVKSQTEGRPPCEPMTKARKKVKRETDLRRRLK